MATVGDNLRILRVERDMTQEDVANKIGITRFSIANYELGRRAPSVKILTKYANAFGITVDKLTDTEYNSNMLSLSELTARVFSDETLPQIQKDEMFMAIMKCYMQNKGK